MLILFIVINYWDVFLFCVKCDHSIGKIPNTNENCRKRNAFIASKNRGKWLAYFIINHNIKLMLWKLMLCLCDIKKQWILLRKRYWIFNHFGEYVIRHLENYMNRGFLIPIRVLDVLIRYLINFDKLPMWLIRYRALGNKKLWLYIYVYIYSKASSP